MPKPDEEIVRRVLARNDRDVRVRACIDRAWDAITAKYQDRPRWRRQSTTRAVMWEDSVDAVLAELDGDDGVKAIPHHDTVSFIVEDTVHFRLKKASVTLFTSNFPTPLSGFFHKHEKDLFGHQGHHRVEIVHVFNRFQTALDWVGVVARDKIRVLWQFELPSGGATVVALPSSPPTQPASESVLRPASAPDATKSDEDRK